MTQIFLKQEWNVKKHFGRSYLLALCFLVRASVTGARKSYRMEQAAQRIANMLEDGYGGNGLRLIELLEKQP